MATTEYPIDANIASSGNVKAETGLATQAAIGDIFGVAGLAMGSSVDTLITRVGAGIVGVTSALQFPEATAPAAGTNVARVGARDVSGNTELYVIFPTGAVVPLAREGIASVPTTAIGISGSSPTRHQVFEHFEAAATQVTNGTLIGATPVSSLLSGTGTQITQTAAATARQGVAAAETGSTATGRGGMYLASNPIFFTAATTDVVYGATVYVQTLSTAGEQFEIRAGINVTFGAAAPANGLYFRLQHGDTNWEAVNVRASAETVTDSGVAAVAATWVNLKIKYTAGGDATYYINGTLVATINTNKPTDTTGLFAVAQIVKAVGTTTRQLHVDAMNLDYNLDINIEQILA